MNKQNNCNVEESFIDLLYYLHKQLEYVDIYQFQMDHSLQVFQVLLLFFSQAKINNTDLAIYLFKEGIYTTATVKIADLVSILGLYQKINNEQCWDLLNIINNHQKLRKKFTRSNVLRCGVLSSNVDQIVVAKFLKEYIHYCENNGYCTMSIEILQHIMNCILFISI